MEKGKVVAYGHEQRELRQRQSEESSQIEAPETLEELRDRYEGLTSRIHALPSDDYPRRSSEYFDRHVYARIDTRDEEIPTLQVHLQTCHPLAEDGSYDDNKSSFLAASWLAGSEGIQQESLQQPNEYTDVGEAGRILGLIEESVIEAERALAPIAA
jgi:hypothetical protein